MVAPIYLPHVQRMIEKRGIYVLHDPRQPSVMVPILSNAGELFSMNVDSMLDPHGFYPGLDLEGPIQCRSDKGHITFNAWRETAEQAFREILSECQHKGVTLSDDLKTRLNLLLNQ